MSLFKFLFLSIWVLLFCTRSYWIRIVFKCSPPPTPFGAAAWHSCRTVVGELWHLTSRGRPPRSLLASAGLCLLFGAWGAPQGECRRSQEFFIRRTWVSIRAWTPLKTALCHTVTVRCQSNRYSDQSGLENRGNEGVLNLQSSSTGASTSDAI